MMPRPLAPVPQVAAWAAGMPRPTLPPPQLLPPPIAATAAPLQQPGGAGVAGGGVSATAAATPAAPGLAPGEKIPVYIGKIPADCDNTFVEELLRACGQVARWRRPEETDTGRLKSFGFCDYDNVDSVRRVSDC